MTLTKVLKTSQRNIQEPIKVTVIAVSSKKTFTDKDGKTVCMWSAAVGDQTMATKINIYSAEHAVKFQTDQTLLIKNYASKGTHLTSNNATKFFKTKHVNLPQQIKQDGLELINPPEQPLINIATARASPSKSKVSISGKVIQANAIREIVTPKSPDKIPIKDIELKDATGQVRCSLWREAAAANIAPGDYVEITNMYVSTFQNSPSLNTTDSSSIRQSEPPQRVIKANIIAICDNEFNDIITLLSDEDDSDEFDTDLASLVNHVNISHGVQLETFDDIQEALPLLLNIRVDNANNVIAYV
ncbi:uncharacterized protein LOC135503382 [Lineus longissimus]|uniref:uncharacterized protein LOC135503382 n=1 Tax=Lineus longissimus TaxID=88925 RepID=UPI00315D47BA